MIKIVKNFSYSILFLFLLLNISINAVVIETNKLEDVFKYADKDSIVVFDIDSTLVEVECGVEYWIKSKCDNLEKMGLSPDQACDFVLYTFFIISRVAKLLPINDSPKIISRLQKMGIVTMALTNRSLPIVKRTIKLLKNIDIDFSKKALFGNNLDLNNSHRGIYSKGIIFAGKNDKGRILSLFFKDVKYVPKKLIYVDDRIEYVKSVEKEFDKNGLEYIGIRYSFMDEKKKNFDYAQAEECIKSFKLKLGLEPFEPIKDDKNCIKVIEKTVEKSENWASFAWKKFTCPFKKAYRACF